MKYLILVALFIVSCSSHPPAKDGAVIGLRLNDTEYEKLIESNTHSDKQYSGFHNTFQVHATMVNTDVQSALLQKESDTLQWDERTAQQNREKFFQEMSSESRFAISLFTPSRKHNDLHKGTSIWKIYLEFEGKRYEGTATKKELQLVQLTKIFPYHTRWSTAYEVTFKVPMTALEKSSSHLVLTSTLGTSKFEYQPVDSYKE